MRALLIACLATVFCVDVGELFRVAARLGLGWREVAFSGEKPYL